MADHESQINAEISRTTNIRYVDPVTKVLLYTESEQEIFDSGDGITSNRQVVPLQDSDLSLPRLTNEAKELEGNLRWAMGAPLRIRLIGGLVTAGVVFIDNLDLTGPFRDRVVSLGIFAVAGAAATEGLAQIVKRYIRVGVLQGQERLDNLKYHIRRLNPQESPHPANDRGLIKGKHIHSIRT